MHRVGRPGSDEQFRRHRRSHNFKTHRQAGAVLALSDVKCCPGYSEPFRITQVFLPRLIWSHLRSLPMRLNRIGM